MAVFSPHTDLRPVSDWLPLTRKQAEARGWDELDVVLVSGDAYVDHPAFGVAVIGRLCESRGLRVGIVAQPNWQDDLRDFKKFGRPRLFFGVTSGCMDSMVNHYTAAKRQRSNDAYTPGGDAGFRPDYAATVYSRILKRLYPDTPIILGGVEASLRRLTHYDYWSDKLRPSILVDSEADLLLYGMGEQPLMQILGLLDRGVPFESLHTVPQTVWLSKDASVPTHKKWQQITLAAHETCLKDKKAFAANFKEIERESNRMHAARLLQAVGNRWVVVNPPCTTMSPKEIDRSFDLPYTRLPHPKYAKRGVIPAWEMIRFSVNTHRGCFGGCSFCTISAHQGKFVASRSEKSILKEVEQVAQMPGFTGQISDLAGPSANMYGMQGVDLAICALCTRPSCIHPSVCSNLNSNHDRMTDLYQRATEVEAVQKVFIGSGIRYDLLVPEYNPRGGRSLGRYLDQVVEHHISGRLKVAPEHSSDAVLKLMRKPSFRYFHLFKKKYEALNRKHGKEQPLVPYFVSSHPGSDDLASADLAIQTKEMGFRLEQVQDFTPTPMTLATVIYYSGYHPYTLRQVAVARSQEEKKDQNMFFFWYKKEFRTRIRQKLRQLGRKDLEKTLLGS